MCFISLPILDSIPFFLLIFLHTLIRSSCCTHSRERESSDAESAAADHERALMARRKQVRDAVCSTLLKARQIAHDRHRSVAAAWRALRAELR
jgi:hypothetical protein